MAEVKDAQATDTQPVEHGPVLKLLENGPMLYDGPLTVQHSNGQTDHREGVTALCRCGASSNKPYCDGNHQACGFKG